jgi:hypothetical protein
MKTVAYIHAYPGATATLAMLWSGFKKLGADLIGVDCVGEPCVWPEPIPRIEAGINAYATEDAYNLPSRLVLTFRHFLTTDYERCAIFEYDTLITGAIPEYPPGFTAHRAGGRLTGSEASEFWHTPWICDRSTAIELCLHGMELMLDGTVGRGPRGVHGSPDMFLGLIADKTGMKFHESGTFSRNTINSPEDIAEARKAIAGGTWMLHGVKTREQLDAILR